MCLRLALLRLIIHNFRILKRCIDFRLIDRAIAFQQKWYRFFAGYLVKNCVLQDCTFSLSGCYVNSVGKGRNQCHQAGTEPLFTEFTDTFILECARVVFAGEHSPRFTPEQAKARLAECPRMMSYNWRDWEPHLESLKESRQYTADCLQKAETELREAIDMLETCEQVLGGSFLQTMAQKELQRRNAETGAVPNGQTDADAPPERVQFTRRRR